jgi:hypothetical protein
MTTSSCGFVPKAIPTSGSSSLPSGWMSRRRRSAAVAEVSEWQPLTGEVEARREPTGQQWAEVCLVPSWAATKKDGPSYRFLAIREPLEQTELPGVEPAQLPFPTMRFEQGRYQVFGVVTNRRLPGEEVIQWQRERLAQG